MLDVTGDARDEIVLWDQNRVWIYTQDRPFKGKQDLRADPESGLQRVELSHERFAAELDGCEISLCQAYGAESLSALQA